MKRSILRHNFALWLVVALALASCPQEEFAGGGQGTWLPYGKYPLELTAVIGEAVATPATRGTIAHGSFPDYGFSALYRVASSIDYPKENEIDWYYGRLHSSTYEINEDGTLEHHFCRGTDYHLLTGQSGRRSPASPTPKPLIALLTNPIHSLWPKPANVRFATPLTCMRHSASRLLPGSLRPYIC